MSRSAAELFLEHQKKHTDKYPRDNMNVSLVDPFVLAQDYPESTTVSLRSGHATYARFSRKGDFLASGRVDGTVVIWDVDTNGVAQKLRGHTRQIQSLSWSTCGRYLLSASQDWKCILWDLKDGSEARIFKFEAPVYVAELHPLYPLWFVASLFDADPVLVNLVPKIPVVRTFQSAPKRPKTDPIEAKKRTSAQESKFAAQEAKIAAQDAKMVTTVTMFSSTGSHILSGTSKGWLNIIDTKTLETIYSTKLSSSVIVLLRLSNSGREMVVNSADRVIRTIQMPDLSKEDLDADRLHIEEEHKFQDVVNRLSWNHVAFSATGDYVTASTYNNHEIYIWERNHGSLVKILEGPKEENGIVEWHPTRPLIAACGLESGRIHLWSIVGPQRWSALAPDFAEVEDNTEYQEREDEFDIHPQAELQQRQFDLENEDIDVLTIDPAMRGMLNGFRMPVFMDVDDSGSEDELVMVGAGTLRRKEDVPMYLDEADAEASGDEKPRRTKKKTKAVKK